MFLDGRYSIQYMYLSPLLELFAGQANARAGAHHKSAGGEEVTGHGVTVAMHTTSKNYSDRRCTDAAVLHPRGNNYLFPLG